MALMDMLRPCSFVELGTFNGDSYCAFCQAVATLGLPTKCVAIDTWQGDAQAGSYGPEVLANLRRAHDPVYGHFSGLMQRTFDEAAPLFQNGRIDLLHVDGLHTYDAVKHDYETWLPKMSSSGVILFHDVAINSSDFGVGRLWQEITPGRPHMHFEHSCGLGVLVVGNTVPAALVEFLNEAARNPVTLRSYFERVGSGLETTRLLKAISVWQMHTQEHVNEWKRRAGEPITLTSTDVRTVFSDGLAYARQISEEVASVLLRQTPTATTPRPPIQPE
jgi:hypothetical protein